MMVSRNEPGNGDGDENSNSGKLLRDIEAISRALYLHKAPQRMLVPQPNARSRSVEKSRPSESTSGLDPRALDGDVLFKDKKGSLWNWKKPLKALAHIGRKKLGICFLLHVHSIEGLPMSFNDIGLSVHWKRKDEVLQTSPSRVSKGIAEFDETLAYGCFVYGSRSGPLHAAKYDPKIFLIYASVVGAPGVHMGKQWLDLTRLLPLTLEELEGGNGSGKWTTSFKLTGKAKGATLNVSLGFSMPGGIEAGSTLSVSELLNLAQNESYMVDPRADFGNEGKAMLQRVRSIPGTLPGRSTPSFQPVEVKLFDETSPPFGFDLPKSMNVLYQKFNEENLGAQENGTDMLAIASDHLPEFESGKKSNGNEYINAQAAVAQQRIKLSGKENLELHTDHVTVSGESAVEVINIDEIFSEDDEDILLSAKSLSLDNLKYDSTSEMKEDGINREKDKVSNQELPVEDLQSLFVDFLLPEAGSLESLLCDAEFEEQECFKAKSSYRSNKVVKRSLSWDEDTESVANEFLNMLTRQSNSSGLTSSGDLDSPRERLLREFENEVLDSGSFFDDDDDATEGHREWDLTEFDFADASEDFDFSLHIKTNEQHRGTSQLLFRRSKAKLVEDLETEALMREWGLSENSFQNSPCMSSEGFGSPIEMPPEEPLALPSLGEGFGPSIYTKDGGCLCSMNPSLLKNSKCSGNLIMQVSCPLVLPSEMGSDDLDILRHLASAGIEKLSLLGNLLLPLEDVKGKALQELVIDTGRAATFFRNVSCRRSPVEHDAFGARNETVGIRADLSPRNIKYNFLDQGLGLDHVGLEDLIPLVMDKITGMSIEGLRIQSGMSEEPAPSSISPQPITKTPSFQGKGSMERAAELELVSNGYSGSDLDELFGVSITLEQWLRLDAGAINADDLSSEPTMSLLVAHHAKCIDIADGSLRRNFNWDEEGGKRRGLLGNQLSVVLKVQLRDPLRNYEPVGASMLALIQLERNYFCHQPEAYSTSSESKDTSIQVAEMGSVATEVIQEWSPYFRVWGVHLSGIHAEPGKTNLWGTRSQQQSGARWLLANGMSKTFKQPLSNSKAIVVSQARSRTKIQNSEYLWSLSSDAANDIGPGWNTAAEFVSHKRNPDISFAK